MQFTDKSEEPCNAAKSESFMGKKQTWAEEKGTSF